MKKIIKESGKEIKILSQEKEEAIDIAIIGMAFKLPKASSQEELWNIIKEQKNCSTSISDERRELSNDVIACYGKKNVVFRKMSYIEGIDNFDYNFFEMSKTEADIIDPNQRLFLENTIKAIEDAGYGIPGVKSSKTGVYVGHDSAGEYKHFVEYYAPEFEKLSFIENLPAMIPGRVSHFLDLRGPSMIINTTCSSSLVALHTACEALKRKECDMAIVGGVKVSLMPIERGNSNENKNKDGRTRVFDENANGAATGEGVITILIKPFERAVKDNDNIYAIIKGSAVNHNGNGASVMAPNPNAEEEIITATWKNAKINPNTISYIECHSVGTKWGDSIEIEGILRAFNRYTNDKQFCAVGSIKTNLGHLDCVSGLVGLVKAVIALRNKSIPPSLPLELSNKNINFNTGAVYYNDIIKPWKQSPCRCGVSASGLNGTNCHVVLEGFYGRGIEVREKMNEYIFTLSAKTPDLLRVSIQDFITYLRNESNREAGMIYDLKDICFTVNTSRGQYDYGIFCIVEDKEDLLKQLCEKEQNFEKITFANKENNSGMDNVQFADRLLREYRITKERKFLMQIRELYYKGIKINWSSFYEKSKYQRVSLPTYHFENSKCWIKDCFRDHDKGKLEDIELVGRGNGKYTENEMLISKIMSRLLNLTKIDINHSFIELGGNSILSVKLELDLEKEGMYLRNFNDCIKQSIRQLSRQICYENKMCNEDMASVSTKSKENIDLLTNKHHIRIFNDLYYKSCFYNALFTILQSCKYPIEHFFINDLIEYQTNNSGIIGVKYHELKNCKQILKEMRVRYKGERYVTNIVEYAKKEITKGNILLIWIDPYHAPIRKDAYMIKHRAHPWVITDVNKKNKEFIVYEHTNSDSLNYQKQTVLFDELGTCYESYTKLYIEDQNGYSCYSFKHNPELLEIIDIDSIYFSNLLAYKEMISSNFNAQVLFIGTLSKYIMDTESLKKNRKIIVNALTELINAKKIEKYLYEIILKNADRLKNVSAYIVDRWEHIRGILLKYYLTDKISEKSQVMLTEEIISIKEYEKELYLLLKR